MARPAFSPVKLETLLCTGCSRNMRPAINSMGNGKFVSLTYYCDTCQYGHEVSVDYATGMPAKYDREETPAKPARAGKA